MKFIFVVQGEGRGHLTQAISLFKILRKNGHEVSQVLVGKSRRRELPKFFAAQVDAPIIQLPSPNFITDRKSKSVKVVNSVIFNLFKIRTFLTSVNTIDRIVKEEQPEAIINFYDFLGGLYFLLKKPRTKHIVLAHQFFLQHSEFQFPEGRLLDRPSIKFGNKLASYGAHKKLALSFKEYINEESSNLFVIPPLLREEIKHQKTTQKSHFLVYMVNHGYSQQVEEFHNKHPEIPIHCFWDKRGEPEVLAKTDNLTFHQLNDKKFIDLMASCRGYLTTAGFESVCEAMYLGKPTLMVPVKGHYEQRCNAIDATKAGAGISSETFDLQFLLDYLPNYENVQEGFHIWCEKAEQLFIQNLTENAD